MSKIMTPIAQGRICAYPKSTWLDYSTGWQPETKIENRHKQTCKSHAKL